MVQQIDIVPIILGLVVIFITMAGIYSARPRKTRTIDTNQKDLLSEDITWQTHDVFPNTTHGGPR